METSKKYPRFVTPNFQPFDPVELMKETEKIVTKQGPHGLERKYEAFYATGVYGGIATGYRIGCCLCCIVCFPKRISTLQNKAFLLVAIKVAE